MKVSVISDKKQLLTIKDSWNDLFKEGNYSVFQSFDYNYFSSKKEVFVVCLFEEGELLELWPLWKVNNKLRFINDVHADVCDVLSRTSSSAIIDFLSDMKLTNKLKLKNLTNDSIAINKLNNLSYFDLSNQINYSVLKLEQTYNFPANFHHFIYRQKRRLKRILKKYSSTHSIYQINNSPFPKDKIIQLKKKMILNGVRNSSFLDDNLLLLIENMYNAGKLLVSSIDIDEELSAISLIFKYNNQYSFWVDLYDNKQMINLYHNTLFIKHITEESNAIFNFGRGAYNYKIQNFRPEILELYELNTFTNNLEKRLFIVLRNMKNKLRKIYKSI